MSSHDHALPGATEFRAMFFRLLGPNSAFTNW